ncbi:MAG: T9SS type A sorting domain-containing protein, partial [Bacteroidia bacterium]|nr:T9SS type A sorting domain-containing protein [Bacteroidia bacterium]
TLTVDWGMNSGAVGVTASNACGNSGTKTRLVNVTCRNSSSILPTAEVVAYPNPVSTELTVEMNTLSAGNYSLTMTDLTGRVMLQQAIAATEGRNDSKLDVSTYAKGVYLLTVKSETGFTKQIRVTVQ